MTLHIYTHIYIYIIFYEYRDMFNVIKYIDIVNSCCNNTRSHCSDP